MNQPVYNLRVYVLVNHDNFHGGQIQHLNVGANSPTLSDDQCAQIEDSIGNVRNASVVYYEPEPGTARDPWKIAQGDKMP